MSRIDPEEFRLVWTAAAQQDMVTRLPEHKQHQREFYDRVAAELIARFMARFLAQPFHGPPTHTDLKLFFDDNWERAGVAILQDMTDAEWRRWFDTPKPAS